MSNNFDAEMTKAMSEKKAFFEKYHDCPESEHVRCLNLIMKKEFAEAIVRGEKTVEFRSYSKHYCDRLFDEKVVAFRSKISEEDIDDYEDFAKPLRLVEKIHFHPYNNSWWLDVEVIDNGIVSSSKEDAEFLKSEYNSTELMEMYEDCQKKNLKERPLLFYFALGKVLDTNLK